MPPWLTQLDAQKKPGGHMAAGQESVAAPQAAKTAGADS